MRFPTYQPSTEDMLERVYPVGSVFVSVVSTNPALLLGIGVWQAIAAGRVLVGVDTGDADFDAAEKTGGAKTVTLTEAQIPAHTHVQSAHNHTQDPHTHLQNAHAHVQSVNSATTGGLNGYTPDASSNTSTTSGYSTANTTAVNQNATATNQAATAVNQNTGGSGSHSNVQPFLAVFIWKRTG